MSEIIIAVDAMGGDNAPEEIVKGSVISIEEMDDIKIILVGKEDEIKEELKKYKYDESRIEIHNASEVIATDEVPTVAIKKKKDSSLVVGLKLVKEGSAQAFISAGNTGALLTGATIMIGRIKGIERPALGTMIPHENGGATFIIDSGANVDAKPNYLVQFAQMGSVYMENVIGIKEPKVGLINIGAEKEKGNALTKETYELLEQSNVNFAGNVEARDISKGVVDIAVCDAFVGNVILKYSEGFSKSLLKIIKKELMGDFLSKIGALLATGAFNRIKEFFDYSDVAGAPFLGLKALVVKAHGNSAAKDVRGAIKQSRLFVKADIVSKIENKLEV